LSDDASALAEALTKLRAAERRVTLGQRTPRTLKYAPGSIVRLDMDDPEGNRRRERRRDYLAGLRKIREAKRAGRRKIGMDGRTATRDALRAEVAELAQRVAPVAERVGIDTSDLGLFIKTWNPELLDRAEVVASRVIHRAKTEPNGAERMTGSNPDATEIEARIANAYKLSDKAALCLELIEAFEQADSAVRYANRTEHGVLMGKTEAECKAYYAERNRKIREAKAPADLLRKYIAALAEPLMAAGERFPDFPSTPLRQFMELWNADYSLFITNAYPAKEYLKRLRLKLQNQEAENPDPIKVTIAEGEGMDGYSDAQLRFLEKAIELQGANRTFNVKAVAKGANIPDHEANPVAHSMPHLITLIGDGDAWFGENNRNREKVKIVVGKYQADRKDWKKAKKAGKLLSAFTAHPLISGAISTGAASVIGFLVGRGTAPTAPPTAASPTASAAAVQPPATTQATTSPATTRGNP
jgi:hypothetical protein